MDRGQKDTEAILKEMEARINREYAQAEKELEEKLNDYLSRFEKKDETWQRWVEEGYKTKEEYQQWRTGQLAVGQRWSAMKQSMSESLAETNEKAKAISYSYSPEIYADNFNFATYQVEHDAHVDTAFTLYSKESVERIMRDDPELLPPPGARVSQEIAEGKAVRWNRQKLQSVMTQGILQGESIPKLATRLATAVGETNRKAAIRNARTMATGAQNAGRVDAYKRAQDMGIDMQQMWLATMDNRTRHSHRWLHEETRPVGEAFSNGCEYPGDPKGDPGEIYNCRCTLRGVVKGLERRAYKYRDNSGLNGMSYDEWRNAKATSNPITLPEEKGNAIKQAYINEYKYGNMGSKEGEYQRYGRNKETAIDHSYIESGEYRRKFDNITDDPNVNRVIYQKSKEMLNHRSGTNIEDMYWVDATTGKIVASELNQKVEKQIIYSEATTKAVQKSNNLIAMHTHPASMPPSIADFNSNCEHNYKTSLILCHDGTIYQYSSKQIVSQELYDLYSQKYINAGYTDKEAQLMALEKIKESYDIVFKEIT